MPLIYNRRGLPLPQVYKTILTQLPQDPSLSSASFVFTDEDRAIAYFNLFKQYLAQEDKRNEAFNKRAILSRSGNIIHIQAKEL